MMTAPDRIWIAPTHRSNGVDDFYLLDPEFRGNRGTEYVRADVVDELVQAAEAMRDWIDAVPDDLPLPTMPGIDRDIIDELIAAHLKGSRP